MRVDHDDIAVIGGGAAGLATAIFARRLNPNRSVVVLDGAKKLGAKILVSGGGRCNVTNAVVTEHDFWGGRPTIVRSVLRALTVADTVRFFEEIGVTLHEEHDGKLFPDSNKAREVLDALVREAERVGVSVLTDHRVDGVLLENGAFTLVTTRGSLRRESTGSRNRRSFAARKAEAMEPDTTSHGCLDTRSSRRHRRSRRSRSSLMSFRASSRAFRTTRN